MPLFAVCSRLTIRPSVRRLLFQSASSSLSPRCSACTILATLIAFLFRFNKVAIYVGTYVNNPFLTLAPIILISYGLGAFLLGLPIRIPAEGIDLLKNPHLLTGAYYRQVFVHSWHIVKPFALGGTVLSVVCSAVSYPLTLWALRKYRRNRAQAR